MPAGAPRPLPLPPRAPTVRDREIRPLATDPEARIRAGWWTPVKRRPAALRAAPPLVPNLPGPDNPVPEIPALVVEVPLGSS